MTSSSAPCDACRRMATAMKSALQKWIEKNPGSGCAMCGFQLPGERYRGLMPYVIVREEPQGENWLPLCHNCAFGFDAVLKPAIYRALVTHAEGEVQESWANGDGRSEPR